MRSLQQACILCLLLVGSFGLCQTATGAANGATTDPTATSADTLLHIVAPGDFLDQIARRYRTQSQHYTVSDFVMAIRGANRLEGDLLRPGQRLLIPLRDADCPVQVAEPVSLGRGVRGIYLPGSACGHSSVFERVDRFIAAGGNGVVFDVKDIDGLVTYPTHSTLAPVAAERSPYVISDLGRLLARLRSRRLYIIARIACFLDGEVGRHHPELALVDSSGRPWPERGQVWLDPAQSEVRRYLVSLAVELAKAGVDEIQLDYVRYPTNSGGGDRAGDRQMTADRRSAVITGFVAQVRQALEGTSVRLSVDLYGVAAWDRLADQAVTGQDIAALAAYVDVICPMLYPSHYREGFAGLEFPAEHPEYCIGEGCRRFASLAGRRIAIRPWLQAFPYKASSYDGIYVLRQIDAAAASRASGWCLWSPSGRYDIAVAALAPSASGCKTSSPSRRPVAIAGSMPGWPLPPGDRAGR
jgi:hypothetical protein